MVYVYDVEIFKNFFSIVLISNDESEKHVYYIYKDHNDIDAIHNLFTEKTNWFVGYNNSGYDDLIIEHILSCYERYSKIGSDQITKELFEYSSDIINDDRNRYSKGLFNSFDLMRVANLYKTLKLVGVNLKHNRIQDLPFPFNHDVQDYEVDEILDYMVNDGEITLKLYNDKRDEIKLRQKLSKKYSQNLMNYPDSGIANRILERDYEQFSGLPQRVFKNINTKREIVHFKDCISDKVEFKTKPLQSLLNAMKEDSADKDRKIEYSVLVGKTVYDIKKGGIHSVRQPEIFKSDDDEVLIDFDITSYYPNIMLKYGICPEHTHQSFLSLLQGYVDTRIKAKREGDKVASDGLKIVVNSIYGKMGNEHHWLYDLEAMYKVTLNGQLFLLMLIEDLELNGIPVHYANTDGAQARVKNNDEFSEICYNWMDNTGFNLEFEHYKKCLIRDVNNFLWVPFEGKPKYKGFFDVNRYKDVTKGYDKPVIPLSISKWFMEDVPIEYTIFEHKDVLDFCMAQKASDQFDIFYDYIDDGKLITTSQQKTNRYYVGKKGGNLYKESDKSKISLVAKQPVHILNDVENRNAKDYPIKYSYYIQEARKIVNLFNNNHGDLFL